MPEREFFRVCTEAYCPGTAYWVTRPASIHNPKDHAVMFITRGYPEYRTVFESVSGCLIFWPKEWEIPERISVETPLFPVKIHTWPTASSIKNKRLPAFTSQIRRWYGIVPSLL